MPLCFLANIKKEEDAALQLQVIGNAIEST
jgi:hypothetical protein